MKFKLSLSIALLLLVVIFTLQNTEIVTIKFLIWDMEISRALLIFLLLGIGIVIGSILGSARTKGPAAKTTSKEWPDTLE